MLGVRWGERRVIRRASQQSLSVPVFREHSFDQLSRNTSADPYVRGDWDADHRRADRAESWGTADAEQTAPLATVREMSRSEPARMDDVSGDDVSGDDVSWDDVSWDEASRREQRPAPASTLTFTLAARPWYRSQRMLSLVVGAAVVAMVVAGVLLVLRSSSAGNEDSTKVTPTATSSLVTQPAAPSATVGDEPLPAGEVPPPPPQPEETTDAPGGTGGYRWTPPSNSQTPTGRPPRPVPISVAPLPRPAPPLGHAAPGDAPKHRGFF